MNRRGKWAWSRIQHGGYCPCCDLQENERGRFHVTSGLSGKEGRNKNSYNGPGSVDIMRWLFVLVITCHIGLGVTQSIPVKVTLSPSSIGPDKTDVQLICDYNMGSSSLSYLLWSGLQPMFSYHAKSGGKKEVKPGYEERIEDWGTISNTSHSMILKDADWCTDLGTYTCQVYNYPPDDDTPADQGQGGKALEASIEITEILLDGKEFNYHKSLNLSESTNVTVTCSSKYVDSSVTVYMDVTRLEIGKKVTQSYKGTTEKEEGSCTYHASVEATFTVEDDEEGVDVNCIREIKGQDNHTFVSDRKVVLKNLEAVLDKRNAVHSGCNTGCIGGVIAAVLAVICVVGIAAFVVVKKSKKCGDKAALKNEPSNGQASKIGVADISGPYPQSV